MFSANSYVKDMDIPEGSIVYGQYPNVIIKKNKKDDVIDFLKERFVI